jgi:hypothetical protein
MLGSVICALTADTLRRSNDTRIAMLFPIGNTSLLLMSEVQG